MTRRTGSHLTYEERCHIYAYLKSGKSNREISILLGCSHSTINQEVRRNTGKRGYRNNQANRRAMERRTTASSYPKKMTPHLMNLIVDILRDNQASPEQIAGRISRNYQIKTIA